MNSSEPFSVTPQIADVQNSVDTRNLRINRVGVKELRHPVRIIDRSRLQQRTIATFNMYVELPHNKKGTHMSRFVEILNNNEHEISMETFPTMLHEVINHLDAEKGRVEMSFPFFLNKKAPATEVESLMDYEVTLAGEANKEQTLSLIKVTVPVTSLCPCSKEISEYGAHNQRSHVTATICTTNIIWIEEIIEMVEDEASCELYGILKRPDEKYVTEKAYDNPKFVEDLVRDIAGRFNTDNRFQAYTISAENFESIHNHSAYAEITYGNPSLK